MDTPIPHVLIENVPCKQLAVGDRAQLMRTLSLQDIQLFAAMSGDVNPAHLDTDYAKDTPFHGVIAHGLWDISTFLPAAESAAPTNLAIQAGVVVFALVALLVIVARERRLAVTSDGVVELAKN